jgi:hypothetical protein
VLAAGLSEQVQIHASRGSIVVPGSSSSGGDASASVTPTPTPTPATGNTTGGGGANATSTPAPTAVVSASSAPSASSTPVPASTTPCVAVYTRAAASAVRHLDAGSYQRLVAPAVTVALVDAVTGAACALSDPARVIGYDVRVTFTAADVAITSIADADQLRCHTVAANGVAATAEVTAGVLGALPSCRITGAFVGTVAIT